MFVKSVEWLKERVKDEKVRIVDCTYSLNDPLHGKNTYEREHIPGAVHFDLADDLSEKVKEHGGRHPLPDIQILKQKLEEAGIDQNTTVVTYDGGEGCFASRFWWLLKYMGHSDVYVLDGGMEAWEKSGFPLTDVKPDFKPVQFTVNLNQDMLADIDDVKAAIADQRTVLIDSRAKERYLGRIEPLDRIPGHIPGAINREWTKGFEAGRWKSCDEQQSRFSDLEKDGKIIVYCGSGVSATPNILALLESGFEQVKLYAGSYSDWVSYPENPVEKEEN
ncbi:sulfurtransferase [Siminovitchia terrae]|uniref:sulfurtransferase n=1 Tax=Siminovitchia terrae TaxID=1914933 RepID=UPI0028A9337C|nr:sulfurtransferase [Siminovitchia terrae]